MMTVAALALAIGGKAMAGTLDQDLDQALLHQQLVHAEIGAATKAVMANEPGTRRASLHAMADLQQCINEGRRIVVRGKAEGMPQIMLDILTAVLDTDQAALDDFKATAGVR